MDFFGSTSFASRVRARYIVIFTFTQATYRTGLFSFFFLIRFVFSNKDVAPALRRHSMNLPTTCF